MKGKDGISFQIRMLTSMVMSLIIACIIETILVSNINMLVAYLAKTQEGSYALSAWEWSGSAVLLFAILGIAIFCISFWLMQGKSFAYITKICIAMKNISSGDMSTRLEIEDDTEFSELAAELNEMTQSLSTLMDNERAAERSKNELITNVAHDLRTPLTSIIGYLELLNSNVQLPDETRKQYTQIAYTKSKRLQQLIEDLFGFTKLNYGKLALKVESFDIVKLISQLMDELYPNFAEKNLTYDLQSDVPSQIITADPNLLARLFDNLLGNAIKYGADGKSIHVKINTDAEFVTVSVINYGKVIPAEELPLIFDKFYRVEQSRSSGTGGTGLGLAIAKNIVSMHQGSINVTSDLHGTAFVVRLKINFDPDKEDLEHA